MNRLFLLGMFVVFTSIAHLSCKSIDACAKKSCDGSSNPVIKKTGDESFDMENTRVEKTKDDVPYRIIANSNYSNMPYPQGVYIARSYEDAIAISEGNEQGIDIFSQIDFKKEAIVFVFAGQFNTGGYKISVDSIKKEGKKNIIAKFSILPPAMDEIVTQAITTPSIIVAIEVKKGEVISASFNE